MIRRSAVGGGERVEFVVASSEPVSVVGDFNAWDALAGGMAIAADGQRHASVTLAAGRYAFRYLNQRGEFFDDHDADGFEPNGHGQVHGLVVVDPIALNLSTGPIIDAGSRQATVQDVRIGRWFRDAMDGHPYLADANVEYFVEDQVIHLEGSVPSRLAKQALWDLAWGVREIRDVDARIAIHAR